MMITKMSDLKIKKNYYKNKRQLQKRLRRIEILTVKKRKKIRQERQVREMN